MKHCTLKLAHARQKEVIRRLTQQLKAEVGVNNAMSKLVFRREDQNPAHLGMLRKATRRKQELLECTPSLRISKAA